MIFWIFPQGIERGKTMQNMIWVELGTDGWNARFLGHHSKEVVDLFGTDTIPTGFTRGASKGSVVAALQVLNPGIEVR